MPEEDSHLPDQIRSQAHPSPPFRAGLPALMWQSRAESPGSAERPVLKDASASAMRYRASRRAPGTRSPCHPGRARARAGSGRPMRRRGERLGRSPVHVLAVSQLEDDHDQPAALHAVEHPEHADANPKDIGVPAQLSGAGRVGILPQPHHGLDDSTTVQDLELSELLFCRPADLNPITRHHASVRPAARREGGSVRGEWP